MRACLGAGVAVEVTPGPSSAIAVPQAAGIPVTHRGTAAAFHVANGQGDLASSTLAAMADPDVTTIVLMGVAALPRLVDTALRYGIAPDLPGTRRVSAPPAPSSARRCATPSGWG